MTIKYRVQERSKNNKGEFMLNSDFDDYESALNFYANKKKLTMHKELSLMEITTETRVLEEERLR